MPRLDKTFSDKDVIRIYQSHLTPEEQTNVLAFFQSEEQLDPNVAVQVRHIVREHSVHVTHGLIALVFMQNSARQLESILGAGLFAPELQGSENDEIAGFLPQLIQFENQVENLSRQLDRFAFLAAPILPVLPILKVISEVLLAYTNLLRTLNGAEVSLDSITDGLDHLVDDLERVRQGLGIEPIDTTTF